METETPVETVGDQDNQKPKEQGINSITPTSFPIHIKYIYSDGTIDGMRNIQITVKRTDLIAEVKQKYINSGKCISPDYIVLCYNGKELSDNTTVMENNLRENATLFHQYTNIAPFARVNYDELARQIKEEALKNKDYHHAGFDPVYGVWDQEWKKGDEWQTYPTVMVPDQDEIKKNAALIPKSTTPFNPLNSNGYTDRVFKSMFVSVVGGFYFEVLHRMEGKWSGTAMLPSDNENNDPVMTCDLKYDPHGYWVELRNNIDCTGLVTSRTIRYSPISNGHLRVEMSDGMYADCKVEMTESSPYLLIVTAVDNLTGKPKMIETLTILDNVHRIRTIQDFSAVGNMTDLFVIDETRILDPSASSLAPYELVHTKQESI